jgi:hypothetical protein
MFVAGVFFGIYLIGVALGIFMMCNAADGKLQDYVLGTCVFLLWPVLLTGLLLILGIERVFRVSIF